MSGINRFTIRVYGIVINEKSDVLLCTEEKDTLRFTKFPGGGLEFGEGIIDCLIREFREELGREIKNISHYYTTENFQQSAFIPTDQLISIYFKADIDGSSVQQGEVNDGIVFSWKPIHELDDDTLTFPVDRHIGKKLKAEYDQLLGA
jgi:8-oxo-dGTP diphosphatase